MQRVELLGKYKNFVLSVENAEDFPVRVRKLLDLTQEILAERMYKYMTCTDINNMRFRVMEGYENKFRKLAKKFGFKVMEELVA